MKRCFLATLVLLTATALMTSVTFTLAGGDSVVGPQDLALTYVSEVDGSSQPYRLYLPSAYDGKQPVPLLIALHGTGGDQNKYFDHPAYQNGLYKTEAEKRGLAVVCPHGRGTTEYRGLGENDVLTVLEEVCRRFLIDRDRIVCSGQSMGGTGTTYLCSRYPDLFSGCHYAFDRSRVSGSRIVKTDIDPKREYTIVCYGSLLTRGDVLHLGSRYGKIQNKLLDLTNIAVAWRAIQNADGQLTASAEQRVRDVGE